MDASTVKEIKMQTRWELRYVGESLNTVLMRSNHFEDGKGWLPFKDVAKFTYLIDAQKVIEILREHEERRGMSED